MAELVPAVFFFRFTFPCRYRVLTAHSPTERLLDLPQQYALPHLAELNRQKTFADVRVAWSEEGLGIQVLVRGKERPPLGDAQRPRSSDGLHVWISTRGGRPIQRADRYCHYFYFLPTGGGEDRESPVAGQLSIPRAIENAPNCSPTDLALYVERYGNGYLLEGVVSAAALHGYDPENHPGLGFFYWIRDLELGDQTLTVGPDFPFWENPSLWCTLQLER